MATPFTSEVVGLRAIHQRASVVRCAEFGELHCKLDLGGFELPYSHFKKRL
jgi:hypothetical protein